MEAATALAWVGVGGAATNGAWAVYVERRRRRPDVTVTGTFSPGVVGDGEPYGGGRRPSVYLTVVTTGGATITAAGVVHASGWRRGRSRKQLTGTLRTPGQAHEYELPQAVLGPEPGWVTLDGNLPDLAELAAEGRLWKAWLRTSTGHIYESAEGFTFTGRPLRYDPDSVSYVEVDAPLPVRDHS